MKVPLLSLVATDTEDLKDGERHDMGMIKFSCFYVVLQTNLLISVFKKTYRYTNVFYFRFFVRFCLTFIGGGGC